MILNARIAVASMVARSELRLFHILFNLLPRL
jgi:hypothetical protein